MKTIKPNINPADASLNEDLDRAGKNAKREANAVIALGGGVGALGLGSSLVLGATCPLCVFVAPGLIGLGLYRRWQSKTAEPSSGIKRID